MWEPATQANDFPRPTDEYGQPGGDHASSRTGPDTAAVMVALSPPVAFHGSDKFLGYGLGLALACCFLFSAVRDGRDLARQLRLIPV
jgi:hypothetical protein